MIRVEVDSLMARRLVQSETPRAEDLAALLSDLKAAVRRAPLPPGHPLRKNVEAWVVAINPVNRRPCVLCGCNDNVRYVLHQRSNRGITSEYCDECIKEAPNELNPDWLRENDPYKTRDEDPNK